MADRFIKIDKDNFNRYVDIDKSWVDEDELNSFTRDADVEIEVLDKAYRLKGSMPALEYVIKMLGLDEDSAIDAEMDWYLNALDDDTFDELLGESSTEEIKKPTEDDIKWLNNWLDLSKESYLKGWEDGHAYIVFGAKVNLSDDGFNPENDWGIINALIKRGFKYKLTQGDYTYKTVGTFNPRSMQAYNRGFDRTLKNRVRLDIYWGEDADKLTEGIDMSKKQLKEDYISGENGLDMWQDDYMINADSYSKEYRDNFLKIQKLKKEIKAAFNNCKTVKEANDCYKESVEKVWDLADEIYNAFGGRRKTPVGISDTLDYFEDAIGDFEDKAITRIERETPKDESLKEGKDMNKLTEAVDRNKLADFIKKAVEDLKISDAYNEIAPTWFFDMGAPNGLHLVIGYDSADNYYAEDLEHLALDKSGKFVVCAKLAVNVDDMQDDFDWDWYMPFDSKTGDVWDTQTTIGKDEDYDAFAQNFIDEFEKMKDLEIDEDGAIIEHEEVVEESKKDCDDKDGKCESCKKKPMKESVEDDLYVMYWIDEDHRDQGIADYFYDIADIEDGKEVVDRLIDFEDYACAELLSGEDVVLYGRDADDTWGDLDESCKKEEKCDGKGCDEEKPLTESADQDDIRSAVYNYMSADGVVNDDMFNLLCDLVERVDDYNDEEDIRSAVDDGMIYDDDQWTAYRYYCNMGDPEDQMWEELTNDVINICSRLAGNNNDDIEINDDVVEEAVEQTITENTGIKVKDVLDFELEDDDTETGGIPYRGYTVEDFLDEVAFSSDGVTFEFEDDEDKDLTLESPVEDLNAILVQCGIRPIKK